MQLNTTTALNKLKLNNYSITQSNVKMFPLKDLQSFPGSVKDQGAQSLPENSYG